MSDLAWQLSRSLRVLNLLDILATLATVGVMGAPEANPLMGALLSWSPAAFVLVKLLGVAALSVFMARQNLVGWLALFNLAYVAALAAHVACLT